MTWREKWLLGGLVVIAIALRLAAANSGPWLDEIMSWEMAREGNVLARHDNNHLLNTLWLWLVGDLPAIVWRLPSVLCGGATVAIAWLLLRRSSAAAAALGATLVGFCYPLIVYQSEARGYALMLLCMLATIEVQLRLLETPTRRLRLMLWLVAAIGVLSHLSFAVFYAIMLAWLATLWARGEVGRRQLMIDHAFPAAMMVFWYVAFGMRMAIGGGPTSSPSAVLSEAIGATLGVAGAAPLTYLAAAGIVIAGLSLARHAHRLPLLLAMLIVLYPAIVTVRTGDLVFVRYFLPAMLALLLMLAFVGAAGWRGRWGRPIVIMLAGVFVTLQMLQAAPLLTHGRDEHQRVLAQIPAGDTIGSDNEFRLRRIAGYYVVGPVVSVDQRPDWIINTGQNQPHAIERAGASYELKGSYGARSWSGIAWSVYRRSESAP